MKYTLKIKDDFKCPLCGNKEFMEKHFQKDGHEKWVYKCEECGHLLAFAEQLKGK